MLSTSRRPCGDTYRRKVCSGRTPQMTYTYLRKVMALCYLPPQHISAIYTRLTRESPSDSATAFLQYVQRTWINSIVWPPASWSVYQMSVRTNNDLEGWCTEHDMSSTAIPWKNRCQCQPPSTRPKHPQGVTLLAQPAQLKGTATDESLHADHTLTRRVLIGANTGSVAVRGQTTPLPTQIIQIHGSENSKTMERLWRGGYICFEQRLSYTDKDYTCLIYFPWGQTTLLPPQIIQIRGSDNSKTMERLWRGGYICFEQRLSYTDHDYTCLIYFPCFISFVYHFICISFLNVYICIIYT